MIKSGEEILKRAPEYWDYNKVLKRRTNSFYYWYQFVDGEKMPVFVKEKRDPKHICPKCLGETSALEVKFKFKRSIWMEKCLNKECARNVISLSTFNQYMEYFVAENLSDVNRWNSIRRNKNNVGLGCVPEGRMVKTNDYNLILESELIQQERKVRFIVYVVQERGIYIRNDDKVFLSGENPLAHMLMASIANEMPLVKLLHTGYFFSNKLIRYDVKYIDKFKNETENIKKKVIDSKKKNVIIHVYGSLNIKCNRQNHLVENVSIKTTNKLNGKEYKINVYYCHNCGYYFVDKDSLFKVSNDWINFSVEYRFVSDQKDGWSAQSQLAFFGYNVSSLSENVAKRHSILAWILDNRILDKLSICSFLEHLICFNGANREVARMCWKEDKEYVESYKINSQREKRGFFQWH